jgi:hypothetical protein
MKIGDLVKDMDGCIGVIVGWYNPKGKHIVYWFHWGWKQLCRESNLEVICEDR